MTPEILDCWAVRFGLSGWRGMLVVETIGRIRREHLVKGKSIKEIARDLKISRNTVRKILRRGRRRFPTSERFSPGHGSAGGRPIWTGC